MQGSVFGAVSLWLFVYEISPEPLNGFAPHSHRTSEDMFGPSLGWVWRSRSKVKVTRNKKRHFSAQIAD